MQPASTTILSELRAYLAEAAQTGRAIYRGVKDEAHPIVFAGFLFFVIGIPLRMAYETFKWLGLF